MKIFVYGTLKKGFGNHRLLEGSKYLGTYEVEGLQLWAPFSHWNNKYGIPHVIFGEGKVTGELYEVNQETLALLDRLEGHPHWYCRHTIEVNGQDADIYIGQPMQGMSLITSGIY